ncbi:MAG: polyhydroxybutyrate depolymerase [Alphaproteobacteria bacterium]
MTDGSMRRAVLAAIALGAGVAAISGTAAACGRDSDCAVDGGVYRVAVPEGWDGRSTLPAAVFFHGYGSSAAGVMGNDGLVRAFSERGILLIVPNGVDRTWSHVGSPSQDRDELAFMDAVRADAMARWPIDEALFWVTGFSQGGSMAWDIACYRGDDYAAFAPIAGAFWEPQATSCPTAAVNMRHVHGTADTVVPMAGRPIAGLWRQGDVLRAVALWRAQDQCRPEPDRVVVEGSLECQEWTSCASGKQVELCLHDGGHMMPRGWLDGAWTWVQSLHG